MRRSRFWIIAICCLVIATGTVAIVQFPSGSKPGKRVEWYTFNRDAITVMNAAGFQVWAVSSGGVEEIPIPFGARIRALLPRHEKIQLALNEMPPGTLRIVASRDENPAVRCLARYHDGYIAVIVLRFARGGRNEAEVLKRALLEAYPRERIVLEEDRKKR